MNEKNMIFEFPKLTGSYKVGSTKRHLVDRNRQEPHKLSEKRELIVHVWYPADIQDANPREVYGKAELQAAKEVSRAQGYPEEDIAILDTTYCHALPDVPLLKRNNPYPVVIFTPGYGTYPWLYTAFCEELSSNGYVVVAIEHTYYVPKTTFPGGRTVYGSPEKLTGFPNYDDFKIWLADTQCTLDVIIEWNRDTSDFFFGRLDTARIGMFGHSYGGGVAFEICAYDDRIKAGISLDAGLFGKATLGDMQKPFKFLMGEKSVETLYMTDEEFAQKFGQPDIIKSVRATDESMRCIIETLNASTAIACMIIAQLEHQGFSDLLIMQEMPLYKNSKHIDNLERRTGVVDGFATMQTINEHIVHFFNKNLT